MRERSQLRVAFLAILACLLWSTPFVVIKIGLRYSKPLSFAGIRFMLAGLMLAPFWWRTQAPLRTVVARFKNILVLSLFQTALLYGLFYTGLTLVSGALGAIVIGSSPMVSAITAHFLMADDEMTVRKTASISLGIMGIVVLSISRSPWTPAGFSEFLGIVLLALGTLSSAVGNVIVARDRHHIDPILLNSCQIFLGGLALLLVSLPLEGMPGVAQPGVFYAALLWLAVISAVAFSLWFILLKQPSVRVSDLNLWKFVIPVFGAILSWTLLPDESPSFFPIIGMLCVAASVLTYNLSYTRRRNPVTGKPPARS